jgi:DNA-binding transcriptional MerR regulator
MGRLMTIGELSKVCRLSVKSLRNYDELGLLKPAEVDESTGYRRYAQEQIADALVIALLRSVDMPLSEVAEVLNELPSGGADVLKRHRLRLEERVERESKLLDHVERLIKGGIMNYEVTVDERPRFQLAAIRRDTTPDKIGKDLTDAWTELSEYLKSSSLAPQDVPVCIYRGWEPNNWVIEAGFVVDGEVTPHEEVHPLEVPGGRCASLIHEGPYEELGLANRAMGKWFTDNGHEMTELPYERYITDPTVETDPAKYKTEVVWPLKDG